MIRPSDIDDLLANRERRRETVPEWCLRQDVDEAILHRLVELFGTVPSMLEGFRLGHDVRKQHEPKGARATSRPTEVPTFEVQFIVVDMSSGELVGDASRDREWAERRAKAANEAATRGAPS